MRLPEIDDEETSDGILDQWLMLKVTKASVKPYIVRKALRVSIPDKPFGHLRGYGEGDGKRSVLLEIRCAVLLWYRCC